MTDEQPVHGRDKLTFLLSLVPYLVDHGHVSVDEAARHFGVPRQNVRDAVNLIAVSGVPGATAAYQPDDLFDIDWDLFLDRDEIVLTHLVALDDSPRFSSREAAALIAGLQYLSALPEQADRHVVGRLLAKLAVGASARPSEVAVGSVAQDADLALVRASVASGTAVEFDYVNARGIRERRIVDPLRVESLDETWYLRGWCHSRTAVRTFRIDRMSAVALTDRPIGPRSSEALLPEGLFEPSDSDVQVDVELDRSALPLIAEYVATVPDDGASPRVRATLRLAHYDRLKRLITGLPGVVTVLGPPDARAQIALWARRGLEHY